MTQQWVATAVEVAASGGWVLISSRQGFLADANGVLFPREWFKKHDVRALAEQGLGLWEGQPVYLLDVLEEPDIPGSYWLGLRHFLIEADISLYKMLSYAAQIGTWLRQYRFCGGCGQKMHPVAGQRCVACESCGISHYPQLSPSMIVLVTKGDEILLARSPHFAQGMYSTLAGFVEPGESVEECVVREVKEEVGLDVVNPRYLGSQNWPFPHSLMLGFHVEYAGGEIVPQPGEIEDAKWFSFDNLPQLPTEKAISRYLIEFYRAELQGLPKPVLPQ